MSIGVTITVRVARAVCAERGVSYAALRRSHRAAWKWTDGRTGWHTEPYGVSVRGIGFDVTCACGWESRTGGAIRERVAEEHADHVLAAAHDFEGVAK